MNAYLLNPGQTSALPIYGKDAIDEAIKNLQPGQWVEVATGQGDVTEVIAGTPDWEAA
jgi:hypothetical protein